MQKVCRAQATGAYSRDFFNAPALGAVLLYCVNNWILKSAYPGWITGKLSDVLFCFFFPLYISAVLRVSTRARQHTALGIGAVVTAVLFAAVNISAYASSALNTALVFVSGMIGADLHTNYADVTDLIAMPAIGLAVWFASKYASENNENIQ